MPVIKREGRKWQAYFSLTPEEWIKLKAFALRHESTPGRILRQFVQGLPQPDPTDASTIALFKATDRFKRQRLVAGEECIPESQLTVEELAAVKLRALEEAVGGVSLDLSGEGEQVEGPTCEDCGLPPTKKLKSILIDPTSIPRMLCEACEEAYRELQGRGGDENGQCDNKSNSKGKSGDVSYPNG